MYQHNDCSYSEQDVYKLRLSPLSRADIIVGVDRYPAARHHRAKIVSQRSDAVAIMTMNIRTQRTPHMTCLPIFRMLKSIPRSKPDGR